MYGVVAICAACTRRKHFHTRGSCNGSWDVLMFPTKAHKPDKNQERAAKSGFSLDCQSGSSIAFPMGLINSLYLVSVYLLDEI